MSFGSVNLPYLQPPTEPEPLTVYALERNGLHFPVIFLAIFALTTVLVIIADMVRRLVLETHLGWRRLIFAGSIVCSIVAFGLEVMFGESYLLIRRIEPAFIYGLVTFIIFFTLAIYGLAIFRWVLVGFKPSDIFSQKSEIEKSTLNLFALETGNEMTSVSESVTRFSSAFLGVLRLIRVLCGFLFGWLVLGLLNGLVLYRLIHHDADSDLMVEFFLIKAIFIALFGGLFFWLRGVINRLHIKKHGTPHPALAKNKWNL